MIFILPLSFISKTKVWLIQRNYVSYQTYPSLDWLLRSIAFEMINECRTIIELWIAYLVCLTYAFCNQLQGFGKQKLNYVSFYPRTFYSICYLQKAVALTVTFNTNFLLWKNIKQWKSCDFFEHEGVEPSYQRVADSISGVFLICIFSRWILKAPLYASNKCIRKIWKRISHFNHGRNSCWA